MNEQGGKEEVEKNEVKKEKHVAVIDKKWKKM